MTSAWVAFVFFFGVVPAAFGLAFWWILETDARRYRRRRAELDARDAWLRFAAWAGLDYPKADVDRAYRLTRQVDRITRTLANDVQARRVDPRKAIETARASLLHVLATDASPYRAAQEVRVEPEPELEPEPESKPRGRAKLYTEDLW